MNEERYFGLAYVCERFHSGQQSKGYRLLSKLKVQHGSMNSWRLLPRNEWSEARQLAAHYIKLARRFPNMF